jgi:hypothetical protein
MKKGVVSQVAVETGISSDSYIEILSGLSVNDEVVTSTAPSSSATTNTTSSPFGGGGLGGAMRMSR